jgi:hypothetical protein
LNLVTFCLLALDQLGRTWYWRFVSFKILRANFNFILVLFRM